MISLNILIQQHSGGSRQYKENNQTDTKPDRIRNNVADNRQIRGYKEWKKKKFRKYLSIGLTKTQATSVYWITKITDEIKDPNRAMPHPQTGRFKMWNIPTHFPWKSQQILF